MEAVESLNRRYLRMEITESEESGLEGYRSRMLQKNKLTGLLATDKRHIDGKAYYYYDVTGLQSMQEREKRIGITERMMEDLISTLARLVEELENYLLQAEEICLLPEYVWHDPETNRWYFLYIPGANREVGKELALFMEFIMDHISCENDSGLERFYTFYSDALREIDSLNIRKMVRLWEKRSGMVTPPEVLEGEAVTEEIPEGTETEREPSVVREKERIYQVPYHGIKIAWSEDATLT